MINGNATWESKLASGQKKPLYALVIDDFAVYILSFSPSAEAVPTEGGYGTAYGTSYGGD